MTKNSQSFSETNTVDEYGYPTRPTSQRKLRNAAVRSSKFLLLKGIALLMSGVGAMLALQRRGKQYSALTPASFHPQRILVIRLDLIGDLVMSLVILPALKRTYPEATIDLLALPSSAKIITPGTDVAQVIPYDPNVWRRPNALLNSKNWREAFALRRRLLAQHYDLAISVFGEWAAILAVVSGATRRIGFGREGYPYFMTDDVPDRHWDSRDSKHEVDYCLELARAAGATIIPEDRVPHLTVAPQAQQDVEQLLEQAGIHTARRRIACHVSSNNGQSKRWPIPYWATLLDRLIREANCDVILTGAPNDLPIIEDILRRMHEYPINMAGKTNLAQLAALLQSADLLITGDSGPMHIACAVGTPLIAIHGPTDPALSGPVSPQATIVRSDIWCSPCYNAQGPADCRFFTTQCMKNITPTQLFTIVLEKLQHTHHVPVRETQQEVHE